MGFWTTVLVALRLRAGQVPVVTDPMHSHRLWLDAVSARRIKIDAGTVQKLRSDAEVVRRVHVEAI